MKFNKIDWNSANSFLSDFIGLFSSKNFATMATWRNDFCSLYWWALKTGLLNLLRSKVNFSERIYEGSRLVACEPQSGDISGRRFSPFSAGEIRDR